MKIVRASVGCLVHGPRSMVLETQDRGSCFMVYGPRSQGQGPTALVPAQQAKIPRPRATALTPRPWILGTGCKIPGTRLGAQQPTSKQPGPRSTDIAPESTPIGLGPNCKGRGIELEPQSPSFRRPRDQDAAPRPTASTGVFVVNGKVQGLRHKRQAGRPWSTVQGTWKRVRCLMPLPAVNDLPASRNAPAGFRSKIRNDPHSYLPNE